MTDLDLDLLSTIAGGAQACGWHPLIGFFCIDLDVPMPD